MASIAGTIERLIAEKQQALDNLEIRYHQKSMHWATIFVGFHLFFLWFAIVRAHPADMVTAFIHLGCFYWQAKQYMKHFNQLVIIKLGARYGDSEDVQGSS